MTVSKIKNFLFRSAQNRDFFLFLFLCFIFLLLCFNYANHLNMWGDEAASFNLAALPVWQSLQIIDVHSPTYYFFLNLITTLTGKSYHDEIPIRLIHAFIFTGGLYFGFKIIKTIFKSTQLTLLAVIFTMLLPTFFFYATNIRMYSLLFLFAMWFIYSILQYLNQTESLSFSKNWNIIVSSFFLVGLDYVGLLYFCIGTLFIVLKAKTEKNQPWKLKLFIFFCIPFILPLTYLIPIKFAPIKSLIVWALNPASSPQEHLSLISLLPKIIFNSSRPFVELTNIAYKHFYVPLLYVFFYSLFLLIGTVLIIKRFFSNKDLRLLFILAIAYLWGVTFFISSSITRIFLPSQFFMSVLILYGLLEFKYTNKFRMILYPLLILFNLYMAFFPLIHFHSLIPYRDIAQNTVALALKNHTTTVLIANNSENYKSITRYILQQKNSKITFHPLNAAFTKQDFPKEKFLFLSYKNENNSFVDAYRFSKEYGRKITIINNYVKLDTLQFNSFWKQNIISKSKQPYAYVLYLIE